MADNPLRLEALVVDRFSKPLGELKRQMAGVKQPNLTPARREFEKFNEEVKRASAAVKEGYGQAMSGLGLTSAVGLLSIAAITGAVKNFAKTTVELRAVAKETGITARSLQLLQGVATEFGVSKEAVTGGMQEFAKNLFDIRRGVGEARGQIALLDRSGGLLKALSGKDHDKALDSALKYLEKLNAVDPERATRLSELLFGTRDFARMTQIPGLLKERLEALAKVKKAPTQKDQEDAQRFINLLEDFNNAASKLGTTIGKELLGPLTDLLTKMNELSESTLGKATASLIQLYKSIKGGTFLDDMISGGEAHVDRRRTGDEAERLQKEIEDKLKKSEEDRKAGRESKVPSWYMNRNLFEAERKNKDAVKEGAKQGVEEGMRGAIEKMSLQGGFFGGGGGRIWNASLGGGGGGQSVGDMQAEETWRRGIQQYAKERALPGATPERGAPIPPGRPGSFGSDAPVPPRRPGDGAAVDPGGMGVDRRKWAGAKTFAAKAPEVMRRLMADFGLNKQEAAIVLGNLGHESAGFTAMQEKRPLIPGSRGGFGWAQWTGPRRRKFEAWAAKQGLDPRSDEANYGFLKEELSTTHKGSIGALKGARSWRDKMVAFENSFERAGIKAWGSRFKYAQRAQEAFDAQPQATRGSAFRAAREAESSINLPPIKGSALLDVRIRGGNADVNASTSGIFQDVQVNRGMTLHSARE